MHLSLYITKAHLQAEERIEQKERSGKEERNMYVNACICGVACFRLCL